MKSEERFGAGLAQSSWGRSTTDSVVFVHELGHTLSGFNLPDALNVSKTENPYRAWIGAPSRNEYAWPDRVETVPGRSWQEQLISPWR